MAVSPAFAANLGLEVRRVYQDAETRIVVLVRQAAELLLAHPERVTRVHLQFQQALRKEIARLRREGRRALAAAVHKAAERGDASALADLRRVGDVE